MDKSNEFSTEKMVQYPGVILPSTGPEFRTERLLARKRRLAEQYAEMQDDDFEDPLAVKIGLWTGDIPSDGWPEEFKPEVVRRILDYFVDIEE